jgi:CRP/FNR family transcriptional regulator, cyclic AMP receptor protein
MAAPTPKYFRPKDFIFKEGDTSQCIYLVRKGTVAIWKRKGNDYIELGRVYANEFLGELSFFDRLPRSAAAIAVTEVEVIEIRFDALDKLYQPVPPYIKTMVASMAERLRRADEAIKRLNKAPVGATVDDPTPEGDESVEGAEQPLDAESALAVTAELPPDDGTSGGGEPEGQGPS